MRFLACLLIAVLALAAFGPRLQQYLPPGYRPFAPLSVDDPPTFITRLKLKRLDSDAPACLAMLEQARAAGRILYSPVGPTMGACPLTNAVRVRAFGPVALSSSFLASCPLAVRSAMFISQSAAPQAQLLLGSPLARIDHLGSYACRNIYNRPQGRLSEHASAEALDIAGFRLANGQHITVREAWRRADAAGGFLRRIFEQSCAYYGNSLGPGYNAAHANHFHLGMRGFGVCR